MQSKTNNISFTKNIHCHDFDNRSCIWNKNDTFVAKSNILEVEKKNYACKKFEAENKKQQSHVWTSKIVLFKKSPAVAVILR